MPQQTSPWIEGKYGWAFGESNWNTGMDENLVKFSFMFDRNVDTIAASLPAAVDGQAHYLTTDNRLYFAVGSTYYSTSVPQWFILVVRSTGQMHQFNGTSLVQIDTPLQTDSRLDAVELTVSEFTSDLSDSSDVLKGAALVGFDGAPLTQYIKNAAIKVVNTIAFLRSVDKTKYTRALVLSHTNLRDGGGGEYYYDSSDIVSTDNNGTVIVAADGGRWKHALNTQVIAPTFGADKTGALDSSTAIQSYIDWAGPNSEVDLGEGTFRIVTGLVVSGARVSIVGRGRHATQLLFAPTTNGSLLTFSAGAAVLYQCGLRDISLFSADATYSKVGVDLIDVSNFSMNRVAISGSVVVSGSTFWSGANSTGLRTRGREVSKFDDVYIAADKPIQISKNPNFTIDIDHFRFDNFLMLGNGNPIITIDTGVNLTQTSFGGYQAWVLGTYGVFWDDTTSSITSNGLVFDRVRWEQGTSSTGYMFYIKRNSALQNVSFNNCFSGSANNDNGYYLRGCDNVTFDTTNYAATSKEALNVDGTVRRIKMTNAFWQAGSTASMVGQVLVSGSQKFSSTSPLVGDGFYDLASATSRETFINGSVSSESITVENGGLYGIGPTGSQGLLLVSDSEGISAIMMLRGTNNAVTEVSDVVGVFSITAGTASSTNIYWSAANSRYELQNNRGAQRRYRIQLIGAYHTT